MSNTTQAGPFGAANGWKVGGGEGGKKATPSLKSAAHTYNDETWHNYTLPKETQKYITHAAHLLISADVSIFSLEISSFCYIKKYRYRFHFNTPFLILLNSFEFLKDVLINMAQILTILAKLAALDLL